jgi:hypothetical protein
LDARAPLRLPWIGQTARGGLVVIALIAPLGTTAIAAADPGTRALSISVGYARFSIPDHSPEGTSLGLDYEIAIADVLSLRASVGGGVYFGDGRSFSGQTVVGVTYQLDVLRYVPYATVGAGGIAIGGDGIETQLYPLVELGGGLDIRTSGSFAFGVLGRFESLIQETSFLTLGARMSFLF